MTTPGTEHRQPPAELPGFEALVLAGGRGSRLGGLDKAAITLGGARLVDRVITAVRNAGANRVTVVGPDSAGTMADFTVREQPAFGGPLAALAAGIPFIAAPQVMVLACDLQHPDRVVQTLSAIRSRGGSAAPGDGAVLVDQDGQVQWLAGLYRTAALAEACRRLGAQAANAPVRRVLGALDLVRIPVDQHTSDDIDTPQALARARREFPQSEQHTDQ